MSTTYTAAKYRACKRWQDVNRARYREMHRKWAHDMRILARLVEALRDERWPCFDYLLGRRKSRY